MSYTQKIKIFRLRTEINLPLAENPNEMANCEVGDLLVSCDGEHVFARDRDISDNDSVDDKNMSLLSIRLSFVEINDLFFEDLTNED